MLMSTKARGPPTLEKRPASEVVDTGTSKRVRNQYHSFRRDQPLLDKTNDQSDHCRLMKCYGSYRMPDNAVSGRTTTHSASFSCS